MPGLDRAVIDQIDWEKALNKVGLDLTTDFVLSPHFDAVFNRNKERLIETTIQGLRSGNYNPRLPITFSVPKKNFLTRPGSILEPKDRLVYHALIDHSADAIEAQLDRTRAFSHVPSNSNTELFRAGHQSWEAFQEAVSNLCENSEFIIRSDIASYFDTIPQHALVNALSSSGVRPEIVSLLEEQLLAFRQRSSAGIIQGLFSSDILGNFYLLDFDADCSLHELPSARYVDDIYVGFPSLHEARRGLVRLSERLRQTGLALNSEKTSISPSAELLGEEREIDRLFASAREEIKDTIEFLKESGYGFQGDWINEPDEVEEVDIDATATRSLFMAEGVTPDQREKIDRFSLPIFRAVDDDSAVTHALDSFDDRPQLTRLYASYLTHFAPSNVDIQQLICHKIREDLFFCDYQRMYLLAAVLNCETIDQRTVGKALQWLQSTTVGPETRAICAIFGAKFGTPAQKRSVRLHYENEPSEYVRAAILFSAQYFPLAEKRNAKRAWGGHSEINALINTTI